MLERGYKIPYTPVDYDFESGAWEARGGFAQTRGFMSHLLSSLDPQFLQHLEQSSVIVDFGCAAGQGVAELSRRFPGVKCVGVDASKAAVALARSLHPDHKFYDAITKVGTAPDWIITSNVLEHIPYPLYALEYLITKAKRGVVAMVPHNEVPLIPGHLTTFYVSSFPGECGDAHLTDLQVTRTPSGVWNGEQVIVVYQKT